MPFQDLLFSRGTCLPGEPSRLVYERGRIEGTCLILCLGDARSLPASGPPPASLWTARRRGPGGARAAYSVGGAKSVTGFLIATGRCARIVRAQEGAQLARSLSGGVTVTVAAAAGLLAGHTGTALALPS